MRKTCKGILSKRFWQTPSKALMADNRIVFSVERANHGIVLHRFAGFSLLTSYFWAGKSGPL